MHNLKDMTLARRAFMEGCAASAFGLTMLPYLPQAAVAADPKAKNGFGKAKRVIWIFLGGGMSQIDTLDPKKGDGPATVIANNAGDHFGSYIEKTAKIADKLTVIRSMNAAIGTHKEASYFMRTAYKEIPTIKHPMIGAYAHKVLGPSHEILPSTVAISGQSKNGNGFLPASMAPLPILDPQAGLQNVQPNGTMDELKAKMRRLEHLNQPFLTRYADQNVRDYKDFYDTAIRLMDGKDSKAFDLTQEPQAMREAYGDSKFGQGCLLARRLVESGVRYIELTFGGWDHHKNLVEGLDEVAPELDTGFSQLVTDLSQRGMLDETLVVLTTEFGRSPGVSNGGRNHHPPAFSVVLAGGGVKRGYVHGATDAKGGSVAKDPVSVPDLHATIGWAMGIDHAKDIIMSPSGRPIPLGDHEAKVVNGVFA